MGRTARITIVFAPFAFAVLPLAALLMTSSGTAPDVASIQVRASETEATQLSSRVADAAYNAEAECPMGAGGI